MREEYTARSSWERARWAARLEARWEGGGGAEGGGAAAGRRGRGGDLEAVLSFDLNEKMDGIVGSGEWGGDEGLDNLGYVKR